MQILAASSPKTTSRVDSDARYCRKEALIIAMISPLAVANIQSCWAHELKYRFKNGHWKSEKASKSVTKNPILKFR